MQPGRNVQCFVTGVISDGNGEALYATGTFVAAGGVAANRIARWDGNSWSGISGGVGRPDFDSAYAAAAFDDGTGGGTELYVGGDFDKVGGVQNNGDCIPGFSCIVAENIAKWNPMTQAWSAVGNGLEWNGPVNALAVFNGELYAGGDFNRADGVFPIDRVAKWNGTSWTQVGTGLSGEVNSLLVFDDGTGPALYAGGNDFGPSGTRVSKWDGNTWTPVGAGLSGGEVYSLAAIGNELYAAGAFTSIAGGATVNFAARWDGSTWSPLGTGLEAGFEPRRALVAFDDGTGPALYAGGEVCVGDFCPAALASSDPTIHRRGVTSDRLTRAPRTKSTSPSGFFGYVAKWNDEAWSALGHGLNDEVHALTVHDDGSGAALYAGGLFTPAYGPRDDNAPPFPTNGVARFDGNGWSSLGTGMKKVVGNPLPPADVRALVTFDEDGPGGNPLLLFAGGDFELAGEVSANNMARWDGSTWSAVGNVGGIVNALAVFDDDGMGGNLEALYAGGDFPGGIAKWDPMSGTWSTVGGSTNGSVDALVVFDDGGGTDLYVGGGFTSAGGVGGTSFVARWDGTTWSAVGTGINAPVFALTVFDADGDDPIHRPFTSAASSRWPAEQVPILWHDGTAAHGREWVPYPIRASGQPAARSLPCWASTTVSCVSSTPAATSPNRLPGRCR